MRSFGATLLLLGIVGFFYASMRLGEAEPLPQGLSVSEGLQYPAGRWDLARYGCAAVGGFGLLMAFFPKGR
jgi:hypothetical protein